MYVTEEEAAGKRCCGPDGCGESVHETDRWCIGSACMAWRWGVKTVTLKSTESPGHADDGWRAKGPSPDLDGTDLRTWINDRVGWCGLAGEPK